MKLIKKVLFAVIFSTALLALGQLQQAKADTAVVSSTASLYTVVDSGTTVSLAGFDTQNGAYQLDSVTITLSGVVTSSTVGVTTSKSFSGTVYSIVSVDLAIPASSGIATTGTTVGGVLDSTATTANPVTYYVDTQTGTLASASAVISDPDLLSPWTAGAVSFSLNGSQNFTNSTSVKASSESAEYVDGKVTVTVTYTYEKVTVVPEPATWAMMFGGLGVLVVVQRMRRSHV